MLRSTESKSGNGNYGASFKHHLIFFLLLYLFWFVLSGFTSAKMLTIGFVSSLAILLITRSLLDIKDVDEKGFYYGFDLPYWRYLSYWPWLLWQVVIASFQVAFIIINPKMPIDPVMVQFRKEMTHPAAFPTLGNSITLTPGTLTVDVDDSGLFTVHALCQETALALVPEEGEGELVTKVGEIFEGLEPMSKG